MNWLKLLQKKLRKKHSLKLRLDVPSGVIGYYFRYGNWSVVNFGWMKDEKHIQFYTQGVYASWEALRDGEIIRANSWQELEDILRRLQSV